MKRKVLSIFKRPEYRSHQSRWNGLQMDNMVENINRAISILINT